MAPPPAALADPDDFAASPSLTLPVRIKDGTFAAIGLIILSTVVFSLGDIFAKSLMTTMHPVEVTWFRYLLFVVMIIPFLLFMHGTDGVKTKFPAFQFGRGMAIVASSTLFILGLGTMPVAETTALAFLGPIFVTALSIPFLGEKVGVHRWAAAFVGFIGVVIVARPGTAAFQLAAFFPIASAFTGGFGAILARKMASEKSETTLAWTAVVGFLFLSLAVPFFWITPSFDQWIDAIMMGVLSTLGHVFVVMAFRKANASLLAPYSYSQLLCVGIFGYIAFGSIPSFWTIVGMGVIASSGLYTAHRERVRGSART